MHDLELLGFYCNLDRAWPKARNVGFVMPAPLVPMHEQNPFLHQHTPVGTTESQVVAGSIRNTLKQHARFSFGNPSGENTFY